jgi:hypothetical protein
MSTFCMPKWDGLGTSCGRCGCWARGIDVPKCPPFITRMEPDGTRLPDIKTHKQNSEAHAKYMSEMDRELETEKAKSRVSA